VGHAIFTKPYLGYVSNMV